MYIANYRVRFLTSYLKYYSFSFQQYHSLDLDLDCIAVKFPRRDICNCFVFVFLKGLSGNPMDNDNSYIEIEDAEE